MCEPTTGTLLASQIVFAALSTGAQYMAAMEEADNHNSYMRQRQEQTTENALAAYRNETTQETNRLLQEDQAASQELQEIRKQSRKQAGEAMASSNAMGTNLDYLLEDYLREEANYKSAVRQELHWKRQQSDFNMKSYQSNAQSRINSTVYQPQSKPSAVAHLATLGLKTAGAYQDYKQLGSKKS